MGQQFIGLSAQNWCSLIQWALRNGVSTERKEKVSYPRYCPALYHFTGFFHMVVKLYAEHGDPALLFGTRCIALLL